MPLAPRLVLAALVAGTAFASGGASADGPGPSVACVRVWPQAIYRNYGYDHVVHLESACEAAADCSVATSVNPEAVRVPIAPGEHVEVLTWRGSPASAFTPKVACELRR